MSEIGKDRPQKVVFLSNILEIQFFSRGDHDAWKIISRGLITWLSGPDGEMAQQLLEAATWRHATRMPDKNQRLHHFHSFSP